MSDQQPSNDQLKQLVRESIGSPSTGSLDAFADEFAEPKLSQPQASLAAAEPVSETDASPASLSSADIEDLRAMARDFREARACQQFVERHGPSSPLPFVPCESSQEIMFGWLRDRGLPITLDNLERCYNDLNGVTPASAPVAPAPAAPAPPRRPISTGLSDTTVPSPYRPSDQESPDLSNLASELASLPLEQARTRMVRLMSAARQRGR